MSGSETQVINVVCFSLHLLFCCLEQFSTSPYKVSCTSS